MSEAIEAIDGSLQDLIALYESSCHTTGKEFIPVDEKKDQLAALEALVREQHRTQENPNHKLTAIQAILDDQVETVATSEEKQIALEGVLTGEFQLNQETDSKSFGDPEEKLDQIAVVVRDKGELYKHPHEKFASIEAILGDHSKSANPWVQAHKSLGLVEESSRRIIKAEEKRQKELRELWQSGMDDKAKLYPEMANDQRWWQRASMVMMFASFAGPAAAGYSDKIAGGVHPLLNRVMTIELDKLTGLVEKGCNLAPELANNQGTQFIQVGSQTSSLEKKDRETLHDWETQQERQDLETQQQLVQEARQNDNSLKERHLEVIKTLTSMIVGR